MAGWKWKKGESFKGSARDQQVKFNELPEDEQVKQMGGFGSSGAWHPGNPTQQTAPLGGNANWYPGNAYAQAQTSTMNPNPYVHAAQTLGIGGGGAGYGVQTAGVVTTGIGAGGAGYWVNSAGNMANPATVQAGYQQYAGQNSINSIHHHDRQIALPGGCSTGTKYVCSYDEHSGWNIQIDTPDPANEPILNHTSFSLSEIEEAQQTIKDLESLHG